MIIFLRLRIRKGSQGTSVRSITHIGGKPYVSVPCDVLILSHQVTAEFSRAKTVQSKNRSHSLYIASLLHTDTNKMRIQIVTYISGFRSQAQEIPYLNIRVKKQTRIDFSIFFYGYRNKLQTPLAKNTVLTGLQH